MPGANQYDPEYIAARRVLLDAIQALGTNRRAVILVGALYQFYAIYSWLQLFVGPLPTMMLGYGLFSSMLKDSEGEQAPPAVTMAKDVGVGAATGGVPGAAGAVVRKV